MLPSLARLSISHLDTEAKLSREEGAHDERPLLGALSPLPNEVQEQILKALSNNDCKALLAICQVNREFDQMCKNDNMWRSFSNDRGWLKHPRFLAQEPPISYRRFYQRLCVILHEYSFGKSFSSAFMRAFNPVSAKDIVTDAESVRILLATGTDPNYIYRPWMNGSVLFKAIGAGNAETVRILLDAGADPNDDDGRPVIIASYEGHVEIVRILLGAGADPNLNDGRSLTFASRRGHTEIVRMLLDAGADPNNDDGGALGAASAYGHVEIVQILLDAGADPYSSVFYRMIELGHLEIAQMLLDAGTEYVIDEIINDIEYATLLGALIAASKRGYTGLVRMLLDANIDPKEELDAVLIQDTSSLTTASGNGHAEVVRILLDAGAYLDGRAGDGEPLKEAILFGHAEIVRILLAAGADPNALHEDPIDSYRLQDTFALTLASERDNAEIVRMLLDAGADPNALYEDPDYEDPSYEGRLALILASERGNAEIVRILLDADADPNAVDFYQKPALTYAMSRGHTEVVQMLLAAGAKP